MKRLIEGNFHMYSIIIMLQFAKEMSQISLEIMCIKVPKAHWVMHIKIASVYAVSNSLY